MSELKLYGMKAAYDEIIASAVKRQHEPARVVGDLLTSEVTEKQARSIRYQITIAKLPLAKLAPCEGDRLREGRLRRARRWHERVAELLGLQTEYEAWLEALPDTLQDTATAEALRTISELDLSELQALDPPRGFGRD
jgi:IstB-like ATP binding protein